MYESEIKRLADGSHDEGHQPRLLKTLSLAIRSSRHGEGNPQLRDSCTSQLGFLNLEISRVKIDLNMR